MQWLQDPGQSNVDNLNNVGREDSRNSREKKAFLEAKFGELVTTSNSKLKILGICIGASVILRRLTSLEQIY